MSDQNRVVNLLVDPATGAILYTNSGAPDFFGYPLEQLKTMNISDFTLLSVQEISEKTRHSEHMQIIPLKIRHACGEIHDARAYASSVTMNRSDALFMCIFNPRPGAARGAPNADWGFIDRHAPS